MFPQLQHFSANEFDHPELMDGAFLTWLDQVRGASGVAFLLSDDARTVAENEALRGQGSSPNSLHMLGRAVDFLPSSRNQDRREALWAIVKAVTTTPTPKACGIELELVFSAKDSHVHLALFPDSRPSRLLVRAD